MDLILEKNSIKLFLISVILFLILFFVNRYYGVITLKGILLTSILLFVLGILLSISIEELRFKDPYKIGFWSSFSFFLLRYSLNPKNSGISNHTIFLIYNTGLSIVFGFFTGTVMIFALWISRKLFMGKKDGNTSDAHEPYLITSMLYALVILLDIYLGSDMKIFFLKPVFFIPFLLASLISSFFSIAYQKNHGFRLNFAYSIIVLVTLFSIFISYIILIEEKKQDGLYTGNVQVAVNNVYLFSFLFFVAWIFILIIFKIPLNSSYLLLILFPLLTGNVVSDDIHGRRAIKYHIQQNRNSNIIGIIGGAGMEDGLWIIIIVTLLIYLIIRSVSLHSMIFS